MTVVNEHHSHESLLQTTKGFVCPSEEIMKRSVVGCCERRRVVRFELDVRVRPCLHINDYTSEEIENCFYSDEENAERKKSLAPLLWMYELGEPSPKKETYRGLECKSVRGARRRRINKLAGLLAVLEEQRRQRKEGFVDEESIRNLYLLESSLACTEAARIGRGDATKAQKTKQSSKKKRKSKKSSVKNQKE